jgi:hypothetical protein
MKKELVMWLVIMALVLGTLFVSAPKEQPMAIKTDGSVQSVKFSGLSSVALSNQSSTSIWIYRTSYYADCNISITGEAKGFLVTLDARSTNGTIQIYTFHASHVGEWTSAGGVIGLNTLYHIVVNYDSSSTSNNPTVTVNGVDVSLTEYGTPSGAYTESSNLWIGSGYRSIIGDTLSYKRYDRFLTSAEILDMYNSRGASYPRNGLVFCPVLYGAKGLHVFDGATLTTSNLIVDPCSGATGVPTGSPVAVGETYLSIK